MADHLVGTLKTNLENAVDFLCTTVFLIRLTSFMFGYGSLGFYRLANSYKLNRFFGLAGMQPIWRWALARANFGLHLAVLVRKT